ncbi:DNA-processing protein DprA [Desulforhopalus singaporensis]|uniref:DNA-processing protein DprA n=1 Tax=Desulforhopalus singaporensis TaxID=91360 RepID=UPI0015A17B74|nr:DNA-processing protein DprA [Desulforhopalus singaporensis]
MNSIVDWITLSFIPGLGVTGFWRLVNHYTSPGAALGASVEKSRKIQGIRTKQLDGFREIGRARERALVELDRIEKSGGQAICWQDADYPGQLRHLVDPPPVLYVQGDPSLLTRPSVAVVGSRAATGYGRRICTGLCSLLAAKGVVVVSGLALGIDTHAHEGALQCGGMTVAVLGCGLDVIYPKQNLSLLEKIRRSGLVVSEYPLGTRPEPFRFPARNRIIAGLTQGVVVVEAAKKSGSLITAQIGLDLGREIFAVPGQVDSFKSEGTHWLLQQGAKLVQNVDDILVEMDGAASCGAAAAGRMRDDPARLQNCAPDLDPDEHALLQCVDCYPQSRDVIVERSGLDSSRVSELLLMLELEGLVELLPGGQVTKVGGGRSD